MPKILKTKAICLASKRIRETSKIVTFFTEKYGRVSLLAKGARNPKSKFGSALELFTCAEVIFYQSELKTVYTLSDAIIVESFTNLKHPDKFFYANQLAELILRTTFFEDRNQKIYDILHSALYLLNSTRYKKKSNYSSLLVGFYIKIIALLGFKPELKHCVVCQSPKPMWFSIEHGGVICNSHTQTHPESVSDISDIKSMRYLLASSISRSLNFSIGKKTLDLVKKYLFYHLEEVDIHSLEINQ